MDYEYLFSKAVHEGLKGRIKGHIFCKVINDTFVVLISTREGIEFEYALENFAYKLILGLINPGGVVNVITSKYKCHLMNVFMY